MNLKEAVTLLAAVSDFARANHSECETKAIAPTVVFCSPHTIIVVHPPLLLSNSDAIGISLYSDWFSPTNRRFVHKSSSNKNLAE